MICLLVVSYVRSISLTCDKIRHAEAWPYSGSFMENEFRESVHKAVNNANLTGALGKFSEAYKVNRAKAYEGIDFEELRGRIAELKSYAASHLDLLSDLFEQNATARGAKVFRTNDPAKVREYI